MSGTDGGLDSMLREAELLAQRMATRGQSDTSTRTPEKPPMEVLVDDEESNGDLDEVLRQSEVLLDKMKSGKSSDSDSDLVRCTPTSVYVVNEQRVSDDVSSVGSHSLRPHQSFQFSLDQENMPEPLPRRDLPGQQLPLGENATGKMGYRSTETGVEDGGKNQSPETSGMDPSKESSSGKWEKVHSAKLGDDDYVPLADFSKAPSQQKSSDKVDQVMEDKTSRLARFKKIERDRRRRRRRVRRIIAGVLLLVSMIGAYALFRRTPNGTQEAADVKISDSNETFEADIVPEAVETVQVVDVPPNAVESDPSDEAESRAAVDEGGQKVETEESESFNDECDSDSMESLSSPDEDTLPNAERYGDINDGDPLGVPVDEPQNQVALSSTGSSYIDDEFSMPLGCRNIVFRLVRKKCRRIRRERRVIARERQLQESFATLE